MSDEIVLKFVNGHGVLPDVPARDLTQSDINISALALNVTPNELIELLLHTTSYEAVSPSKKAAKGPSENK